MPPIAGHLISFFPRHRLCTRNPPTPSLTADDCLLGLGVGVLHLWRRGAGVVPVVGAAGGGHAGRRPAHQRGVCSLCVCVCACAPPGLQGLERGNPAQAAAVPNGTSCSTDSGWHCSVGSLDWAGGMLPQMLAPTAYRFLTRTSATLPALTRLQGELRYITRNTAASRPLSAIPWRLLLSKPATWALIISHFCHNWGTFILLTWMPTYYNQVGPGRTAPRAGRVPPVAHAFVQHPSTHMHAGQPPGANTSAPLMAHTPHSANPHSPPPPPPPLPSPPPPPHPCRCWAWTSSPRASSRCCPG